jgi:hypothetical protein
MEAMSAPPFQDDLAGVSNPDFLAIGLGGTSMMSMLWTVALGRRAVGVEMRGDPFLGVHWNLRVDLFHQLGLIDQLMFDRYGEDGVPRRGDGRLFRLAECFYSPNTVAGDIVADEIIDGFDSAQHIVGTIHHVEFIDDRWRDGFPNRVVTLLQPPAPPDNPHPPSIRENVAEVLDGPSTFQAGAASVLVLLRRYLEKVEQLDRKRGRIPRVRIFSRHRVLPGEEGFYDGGDGRLGVRIEALQEFDYRGKFVRIRLPGTEVIDVGAPELFMIAEGFHSTDAQRLGFHQHDVEIDHGDGRGPVVAQADFLAGLIEALVGGRLRRRISSEFDKDGNEYWVRQIAVGHEEDPEVGWVLVQVPDFKTFDPIEAGVLPDGTDKDSPEFFGAYQNLLHEYYLQQASDILEIPKEELRGIEMVYGPKLFSLIERAGDNPLVAPNGVVAGDSFGNGHFLTSGGAITGMVGHSARVLRYWRDRDEGVEHATAIRILAEGIKEDTEGWLQVSAREYTEAAPINFGAERIAQITGAAPDGGGHGGSGVHTPHAIDAARRQRHSLLPLDPSDWRRLFLRNGAVRSAPLPELHAMHPALRSQRPAVKGAHVTAVVVVPRFTSEALRLIRAVIEQPGARVWLISDVGSYVLPEKMLHRLAGYWRIGDCTQQDQIEGAIGKLTAAHGDADLLLGTAPELEMVLGEVRDALRIPGPSAEAVRRFTDPTAMLDALRAAGLPVAADVDEPSVAALTCTFEVMSINGVPAWWSATRRSVATPGASRTVTLPREDGDPADPAVRQMGLAALRALGMASGLSEITWLRYPSGLAAIVDVQARPPAPEIMALLSQAHGADMYKAWANAAVRGLFAPIPRLEAAGYAAVAVDGTGETVQAVHGWDKLAAELGDLVVEASLPVVAAKAPVADVEPHVVLRHADTKVVDEALERVATGVRIELG